MSDSTTAELVPSLRDLKARAGSTPLAAAVRAQIDSIQSKKARSDNEYLELKLADAQDTTVLRFWSDSPAYKIAQRLLARTFVEVSGEWTQGQFGLDVRQPVLRELTADESAAVLAGSDALRAKQAEDYAFIADTAGSLADPRLRALCVRFLEVYGERFRRTGAARDYHHARRGGLIEHVAQMTRTALAISCAYPYLNRDLLAAGVLFHDCGKLWENCYAAEGFGMPYDERGELLGHITIGIELVNRLWRDILESEAGNGWRDLEPATEDVRLHLLHLIASHHGEMQFGSPVWPKTPEAIVLHHVDNIDAKLEMMADGYATSAALGKNILERRRPLPGNLVRPLPAHEPTAPEPDASQA